MTCRHAPGDPNCGSYARSDAAFQAERVRQLEAKLAAPKTPDAENYTIEEVQRIGPHLVLKVKYPNCQKCSYEGSKVMVYLNVTEAQVLRWRRIDPHFSDPTDVSRLPSHAPGPNARFPASKEGWLDAVAYAQSREAGYKR